MKELYKGKLTFITPCFLAGANQNEPEIRVSSIRGELRWWFRVVGGTAEDERNVFGGIGENAKASAVVLRTRGESIKRGNKIEINPNTNRGYLYYFAKASGNAQGVRRTETGHYISEGSSFILEVLERYPFDEKLHKLLDKALAYFLRYGALGLRATRGCGAFTAENLPEIQNDPKIVVGKVSDDLYKTGMKCQEALGDYLRGLRHDNHLSGKKRSALGFSDGRERITSALRLRPVEKGDGFAPYVIYTDNACGESSIESMVKNSGIELI